MFGFEVLGFDDIGANSAIPLEANRHVTDDVLDELRVIVGALGDVLLVRPLQYPEHLAGRLLLGDVDQLLDPQVLSSARRDADVRALVVCAALRDVPRARTEARHRDDDPHPGIDHAVVDLTYKPRRVVHQALHARDGSGLEHEVGEIHLDVPRRGIEPLRHLAQHLPE
jgi:hypothetical protein